MRINIISVVFISFLSACSNIIEEKTSINNTVDEYNLKVINSIIDTTPKTDSLYIFFEAEFNSDKIEVVINEKEVISKKISTDEVTGLAKIIKIGHFEDIKKLEYKINNGSLIEVDLGDNRLRFITVSLFDGKEGKIIEMTYKNRISGYY